MKEIIPVGNQLHPRTNSEITKAAREALSGNWLFAVSAVLIQCAISILIYIFQHFSNGFILGTISDLAPQIIAGPILLGFSFFYLKIIREDDPDIFLIFKGFERFFTAFCANLFISIFTTLWMILFIIPGIVKGYSYAMTFFIIADNPDMGALEAITESRKIMYGNRMRLFYLSGRFVGWSILCIFTFGLGFLLLVPYVAMSLACFYEDIRVRHCESIDELNVDYKAPDCLQNPLDKDLEY